MLAGVAAGSSVIWKWLAINGAAVQALTALLSLLAIVIAARQVGESSAQRDVGNSFELLERFNALLSAWSASSDGTKSRDLGNLLGAIEVAAGSTNQRRFSKVTRYFVKHLIKDALCLIVGDEESEREVRGLMADDREVCRQIRLFLALNFRLMKNVSARSDIYSTFFAGESVISIWDGTIAGWLERRWYSRRVLWGHV